MDRKQINDPKMTVNFLIWVGGVFMLALFVVLLAHFVWRGFIAWRPAKKMAPFLGPSFEEANLVGVSGKAMQVTVPPAGTALREKFGREESEGHCFGLRPLGYMQGSICRAKSGKCERGV
jgi:hypothetical protein